MDPRDQLIIDMLETGKPSAPPPPDLVDEIMRRVEAMPVPERQHRGRVIWGRWGLGSRWREERWNSRRTILLGMTAAAVIVLAVFRVTGFPRIDRGADATIGAAGAAAGRQFMQSELFDRLARDPDTRQLLSNPAFRALLDDANFRTVIADRELRGTLRQIVADAARSPVPADDALMQTHDAGAWRALVREKKVAAILDDAELRLRIGGAEFETVVTSVPFRQALDDEGFLAALKDPAFAQRLAEY